MNSANGLVKVLGLILATLLGFALLPGAFAQTSTGSVQGVVKDPTGAVVTGAKVTIVSVATGFNRTAKTDSGGSYALLDLSPGEYRIAVESPGFARTEQSVVVDVGSRIGLDIVLTVGKGNEIVEVVGGGGAVVNIVNQEVSSVVTSDEIAQLPTLTRNPYDLVATAANAQQDSQAGVGDMRGAGFSLNGQRSASTSILMDGGENVDLFTSQVGQTVPLDSVHEFRVISNGMTAEYGRASGGVVNVVTKSGTNQFHGGAYEFNRVAALSSNTYSNASSSLPKGGFTRNQFGFSIGGPIVKDKLFFFNNTEWVRVRSSAPFLVAVPDPAFIAAANSNTQSFFSAFGNLKPGLTPVSVATQADVVASGIVPGPAFGALAPTTPIWDTVSYHVPGDAGGGAPQNTLMTVGRVDFNPSERTQIFGRYAYYNEKDFSGFINNSPYVGYETGQSNLDNNFLLSVSHTFGVNFLSNTRLIGTRLNGPVDPLGAAPVGPTLYFRNSSGARFGGNLIAFPGYNEYTPGNAIPFGGPQNLAQIYQDFSYVHHSHTFRFGGQYIRTQDNRAFGAYEEAVEALSRSGASHAYDQFLNGSLDVFQAAVDPQGKFPCLHDPNTGAAIVTAACTVTLPVSAPQFSRSNMYNDSAIYGQDTWKVTNRLTLDLGLRWEYYGVQHNRNPKLDSNFYPASGDIFDAFRNGSVQLAPQSPVGGLWAPQKKNFGPRVGFAYDVFGDGKTSIRGGYGIAYERNFGNVTFNVIQNPPNYAVLALTPADVGPISITNSNAGPLAGTTGSKPLGRVSLRFVSPNIKTAYTEQFNLGLERELAPSVIASLGFNGARGIHQYSISNINDSGSAQVYLGDTSPNLRLNTQYSNINNRGSSGDSSYRALVAGLRGTKKGVQWNANYTYSHSIDTISSTFSDEVQNNGLGYVDPFNPALDKGSSDYDARHRLSLSAVVPLPFFKNSSSRFLKESLGGWQFAPIYSYHSGYPFTVFDCAWSAATYNCPRADLIPGAKVPKGGSAGPDLGGNTFNYMSLPASIPDPVTGNPGANEYTGPAFITGTTTPFPFNASNFPTCTGLFHSGCSYPSNMVGRNSFVGPGNWNLNFGVYKNFKVTERVGLQLRGEFFDLTNHKNFYVFGFGVGGADVSSLPTDANGNPIVRAVKGGYGNPFDDHRNLQIAMKLTF